ncbi:UNVERIFIED_CONTAM: hypothetical protein PYX00_007744 [Menopon gallinae]|uniref:DNA mismatch repair protein S5 domain-containing protein n=1 Tax=Menopon gallinae TaxID=328185 RepID=A0AAW2HLH9_9NEOP
MQVIGLKIVTKLEHLNELANNILIDLMIPRKDLDNIDNLFTSSSQSVFTYVNRRGVTLSKLSKVVMEHIFLKYSHLNPTGKYSVCLISIEVPPQELDVNLEPNKTKVLLKNEVEVIALIDKVLGSYYGQTISRPETEPDVESMNVEGLKDEEEDENNESKRLRLDEGETLVTDVRDKEFTDKNSGWKLHVITENDGNIEKNTARSLCSQINKENCTLTTREEVKELNKLVNKNSQNLFTSAETRAVERNEIQSCDRMKSIVTTDSRENVSEKTEKPILPSWPIRQTSQKVVESVEKPVVSVSEETEKSKDDLISVDVLEKIDLVDWSMGRVGNEALPDSVLGGEEVLPGGVELARPEVSEEDLKHFDLSMQSVSSQMGKKELSAFTKFARVMRPKSKCSQSVC